MSNLLSNIVVLVQANHIEAIQRPIIKRTLIALFSASSSRIESGTCCLTNLFIGAVAGTISVELVDATPCSVANVKHIHDEPHASPQNYQVFMMHESLITIKPV